MKTRQPITLRESWVQSPINENTVIAAEELEKSLMNFGKILEMRLPDCLSKKKALELYEEVSIQAYAALIYGFTEQEMTVYQIEEPPF